jgi:autotransporter-associated beta strand protein
MRKISGGSRFRATRSPLRRWINSNGQSKTAPSRKSNTANPPLTHEIEIPLDLCRIVHRLHLRRSVPAHTLHAADWLSTGTTDWNTASNWNTNAVPVGQAAVILTNTGSIATITANPIGNPNDVIVGNASGTNGRVDHSAGTLTTGSWVKIGHNSGNGTYNLANTAGTGGTLTGFGQGGGSFNMTGGQFRLGGDNGTNTLGNGTFNMHTTGTVTVNNGAVAIGQNGNGTLNIDSGIFNKTGSGNFVVGGTSGRTGTLNISGGTINNSGEFQVSNSGSTGVVTMTGGAIITSSWVGIGHGGGGTGTLNVNGGTFTKTGTGSAFIVGDGSNGFLNQTNGTISIPQAEVWFGNGTASTTTNYNMSGGTFDAANWFVIGRSGGTATFTMTGGTINHTGTGSDLVVGADTAGCNGTVLLSGGLMNISGRNTDIGKGAGVGVVSISSSGEFRTGVMMLGAGASATGTLNLNGGTLKVSALSGGDGSATANFNGGLLQAQANSSTFISGLDTADIQAGGALIDTQAFSVTAAQAFSGSGNITKSGSGTLTLAGNSINHTGNVVVNSGTLAIFNTGFGGTDFTIADGAELKCFGTNGFDTRTLGTLTMGTSAATVLSFDLGNQPGNPSFAPMAANFLVLNGTVTVNVADLDISLGTVPLLQYSGKTGSGSVVLGTLPTGVTANLVDDGLGLISLNVTSLAQPRWDASLSDVWDTTTFNWLNAGFSSTYSDGSTTQFDDTVGGITQGAVVLNSTVTPISLTFDNSLVPYSLNGTGNISGTTGLLKKGFQSLELNTANSYTGITELQGGTTSISSIANAGSPSSIGAATASPANLHLTGGNLTYTGTAATSDRGFTIGAANTTISTTADIRFDGEVVSNANSNLIKTGTGTLGFGGTSAKTIGTINKGLRIIEGTVSFSGSGPNNVASELWLGDPLATSNSGLEVTNSNLTSGYWLAVGIGNGTTGLTSTVTLTNSTVTQNGGGVSLGYSAGLVGYLANSNLTLNSSTLNTANLEIGRSTGSTAVVTVNGTSTINSTGYLQIGIETGVGTVTLKDTSVFNSGADVYIGAATGSTGTLEVMDSASISVPGGQEFRIGNSGVGTLTQTGGSVSASGWMAIGRGTGGNGTLNLSGGVFTQAATDRFIHVGEDGAGTLNISGTGSFIANSTTGLLLGDNAASSGTVNLNGGSLTATAVLDNASGTTAFNFNGGLLIAGTGANATFMSGIDTVTVQAGGALIDSNGSSITVNTPLLDGGTDGGLTKQGSGDLNLTGVNTYGGNTTVNTGSLTLADNAQLRFVIGANGVSNSIGGTGTLLLDGDLNIDTSGANTTNGNTWTPRRRRLPRMKPTAAILQPHRASPTTPVSGR